MLSETSSFLAQEILALTKMNWNNTQFDGGQPITLRCARQVGHILKYLGPNDPCEPILSFLYVNHFYLTPPLERKSESLLKEALAL